MSVTELPVRTAGDADRAQSHDRVRRRWQPSRAGILNVWRYYDETFGFHEGRLLLRGQNGTGKSKALELLLPFLFDASLRPNRLSTFGGSERTMHWNLMGEGASGKTRVGYVWVEFARASPDGGHAWFCCGARLQASVHTRGVQADYFTTTRRIAEPGGLSLTNDAGQPLTRASLAEALHGHGDLHGSAADYRAAVRGTLFPGLSEQRYDALITALLQLRTPKLSERLDPSLLSSLLSRALPPLGQGEISELAEGFERLDRQREHLRRLDEEVAAAETVAAQQRGYAQRVLRAAAASLISATTEMDNLTRIARESADQHARTLLDQEEWGRSREELEHRGQELEAAVEGLVDSDDYKRGEELDTLRRRTDQAVGKATQLRGHVEDKSRVARTDARLADDSDRRAEQWADQARAAHEDTRQAARRAGMESVCREAEAMFGPATADDTDAAGQGRGARLLLRGAVTARRDRIARVREAIGGHDRAVGNRTAAEGALEATRTRLAEASTRRDAAARAYEAALEKQGEELREWTDGCVELRIGDVAELVSRAAAEADVLALVEAATRVVDREIIEGETGARAARDDALADRAEITEGIERLSREAELPPAAPLTRTADRTAMEGAPLWRLLSFRDGVPAAVQAGVEAALEASGLLDAWIGAKGGIEVPGHDTLADPARATPAPGPSLLEVLGPEADAPVPADRVERLLAGIAYGPRLPPEHMAAVGADGGWRLATATGTWSKPEPAHIGAFARERARRRRVAELTERLYEVNASVTALEARLRGFRERRERLDADLAARPDHRRVSERRRDWDRAEESVGARDDAVREAVAQLAEREGEATAALRALNALSAEHTLPTDRQALEDLARALDGFRETADVWADARIHWAAALGTAAAARGQAERSRALAEEHAAEAESAEAEARGLVATLEAVESTVGEDFRQVAARISELRGELDRCRGQVKATEAELLALARRVGSLETTMADDADRRDRAVGARDSAARRFRHLCLLGLPEDAGLGLAPTAQDGTRATLEAARAVAAAWPNVPHAARNLGDAVNRLSEAVHKARQSLGSRADLDLEADEDVQVFSAAMDGRRVGAAGLLSTLTTERDHSREDITAAERKLFDQTLTGDTRRHLAARIRQANELVDRMNGYLERVRTASKVAVRLVWQIHPELPAGTRTARELLLKDPERITEADREALHTFFRGRIEEAKAKNTAVTWEEQLADVLDYTAWHQFVVKLDRANGAGWQLLTKKLHGALSGGEKAIALHLPLFAAVAAHHEAVPEAPRLILLDEVFVGVDTTNRGQIFALLDALDLDLMLTSDHEWCTYQELSGIAVHQLITGADGDDAVTSARFVWNGTGLLPDGTEGPEDLGGPRYE